jgi:hypothetical protein
VRAVEKEETVARRRRLVTPRSQTPDLARRHRHRHRDPGTPRYRRDDDDARRFRCPDVRAPCRSTAAGFDFRLRDARAVQLCRHPPHAAGREQL